MEKKWWNNKIVYQIYPKSFADSNNDGIGDIQGIISHLDYLKLLGVDILWLTPYFASPMEDNGYDVANYYDINPMFGTMEDMDRLIEECKKRDMYIMMDIVANHTSSENYWFKESRKSKDNPYRDYYIWKDEKLFDLQSCFGGSAWEYDENTKQYYFHEFGVGQPDLNWENPKVMEEMTKVINFWMDKGIKGIRFDVIHMLGKEIEKNILFYGPTLHEKIRKLNELSFGKYDAITVGEAWGTLQNAIDFTKPENKELSLVFQFECTSSTSSNTSAGKFNPKPIDMNNIKNILIKYQNGLNDISWNSLFVENHDLGRCINKFGHIKYRKESAKEIATTFYMLKGIPFIYQGQELGMLNNRVKSLDDYDDLEIHGNYKDIVLRDKIISYEEFLNGCYKEGRDNNRFPMQWDDSINAGFNKGAKPWLQVNSNYKEINAKEELEDNDSIFNYYRKLLEIRKNSKYSSTIVYGSFNNIDVKNENVFVYTRNEEYNICVVSNMNKYVEEITLPYEIKEVILSNYQKERKGYNLKLQPYETIVYIY